MPKTETQAYENVGVYLETVRMLGEQKLGSSATVKLTTLGALFDKTICTEHVQTILREAANCNVGFEIATEGKALVPYAVQTAVACAEENHDVTLALQAYLDRSVEDLELMLKNGVKPRIVKGAYLGDTNDYVKIQDRFKDLADIVLENQQPLKLGTHDPELLQWVMQRANKNKQLVEFGFLKGLADDTKVALVAEGWKVTEYTPFGDNTENYELRRAIFLRELKRLGRTTAP